MVKSKVIQINEDVIPMVRNWILRIGPREARLRLSAAGISWRLAEGLVAGSYEHKLRFETKEMILNAIRREAV
jgi:hypothetical protein